MSSNQAPESNNQHNIYQQQSYNAYPSSAAMGTWGQPQPQAVPYAIPYHGDLSSAYTDKNTYSAGYPLQFGGGGDSDYYRSSYAPYAAHPQQNQIGQWQQPNYPAYTQQSYVGYTADRETARGAPFNPGAPPPNMNRPPPNMKRENENSFPSSLSMLDNPLQSSAAYTASWVSSTSSIPPDLKDEPEFAGLPQRHDMNQDVFSAQNFGQFENLTIHDPVKHNGAEIGHWENKQMGMLQQQWPGLRQQQENMAMNKKFDRDRRPRDEQARELTWEERLRKAQVQKERVEQRGNAAGLLPERTDPTIARNIRPRGRGGLRDSGRENKRNDIIPNAGVKEWKNDQLIDQDVMNAQNRGNARGRGNMPMRGMPFTMAPPMPPMFPGVGQQMMMPPRGTPFIRGGHPHMMGLQQDERFKNTWLDANAFPQPFMAYPPMPFPVDSRFVNRGGRGRGAGAGGRGGRAVHGRRDRREDSDRKEENEILPESTDKSENSPVVRSEPTIDASSTDQPAV